MEDKRISTARGLSGVPPLASQCTPFNNSVCGFWSARPGHLSLCSRPKPLSVWLGAPG